MWIFGEMADLEQRTYKISLRNLDVLKKKGNSQQKIRAYQQKSGHGSVAAFLPNMFKALSSIPSPSWTHKQKGHEYVKTPLALT